MTTLDYILFGIIIALVLCPPKWDPFIRWKARNEQPTCYGDYPFLHGQEAAERDCAHCSHAYGCHEDSPDPRGKTDGPAS